MVRKEKNKDEYNCANSDIPFPCIYYAMIDFILQVIVKLNLAYLTRYVHFCILYILVIYFSLCFPLFLVGKSAIFYLKIKLKTNFNEIQSLIS